MSNPSTGDIQHGVKLNERRRFQHLTGKRPVRYRVKDGPAVCSSRTRRCR